jgi:lysophospholipase L1-like esterase
VDCSGATSIQKTTRTFTARTGAVSIDKTTTPQIYIAAVVCYLSTAKSVSVFNWGLGGSAAATWAANTNPWDASYPGGIMSKVAPDLTIINLNINDWVAGTVAATYKASLRTVILAAQATGDVVLRTGFPSAVGSASLANQLAITQALRQVAQDDGLPLIDMARFWGDYTAAAAAGYFAPANDTVHPGAAGYANAAQCIFESI